LDKFKKFTENIEKKADQEIANIEAREQKLIEDKAKEKVKKKYNLEKEYKKAQTRILEKQKEADKLQETMDKIDLKEKKKEAESRLDKAEEVLDKIQEKKDQ